MKTNLRVAAWVILAGYASAALLYGIYMCVLLWQQAHPEPGSLGPLWCGNTVTSPLVPILNWGTPLALVSLAWLIRSRRAVARPALQIVLAHIAFGVPTAGLLGFALWFFYGPPLDGDFRIADQVWWIFGI